MNNSMQKAKISVDFSRDLDGQRILQSDWLRATTDNTQQKWYSQILPSFDDYLQAKKLRYHFIPSRDINGQRIQ